MSRPGAPGAAAGTPGAVVDAWPDGLTTAALDGLGGASRGEVALFVHRVADLVRAPAVTCRPSTTAADAARLMTRESVSSVVVVEPNGAPIGIVTDRDLRRKVVAQDRAPATPVSLIMSAPVVGIDRSRYAFDALLEMTRRSIHHLAVLDEGRLAGVVSSTDIMWLQGAHPVMLARDIERQSSTAGLAELAPRLHTVVRWLFEAGAGVLPIGQIVAELNDRLVRRVVALVEAELDQQGAGPPPLGYSWVALGSEGRREQTLRTDQDNALAHEDPPAGDEAAAAAYFGRLAREASAALVGVGFPVCEGGFMASNPRWCQSASRWRESFAQWMATPRPEALLHAALFFDWRPVAGRAEVGEAVWRWVCEQSPGHTVFLRHMARAAADRHPPLGLFGRLRVERSGPRRGTIDLKAMGVFPFTQAVRVLALALGVADTNTVERLMQAGARGALAPGEVRELREAFEVICRLRLARQLQCLQVGLAPDNRIEPAALGRADQVLLREAFRSLGWFQRSLEERFQTARIA